MKTIIRGAKIVNEGEIFYADVLISGERIEKIDSSINIKSPTAYYEINAENLVLIPGVIDDQVHFREPGLTHKATIYSESKAAVAGGITSFMDMPNTIPNTLTKKLLEEKYSLAGNSSFANYSFFMGITKDNLEEALSIDNENVCGITDDGLYFNNNSILANHPDFLELLFSKSNSLIALHSEDEGIINSNTKKFRQQYGDDIPFNIHPLIRSEEACFISTKRIIDISKKYQNRLHLFHLSTKAEADLLDNTRPIQKKRITAEVCVHHLYFDESKYDSLGAKLKWNPAVKTEQDKNGLMKALLDNRIDIIATDHAPHTIEEKSGNYFNTPSGGPLVQHALPAVLELYHKGKIELTDIVQKMSHNVAEAYKIKERGYIREGYFADLVIVNLNAKWKVMNDAILYKCKWSPFEGECFKSKIIKTFVNGNLVYDSGAFNEIKNGMRLKFEKER